MGWKLHVGDTRPHLQVWRGRSLTSLESRMLMKPPLTWYLVLPSGSSTSRTTLKTWRYSVTSPETGRATFSAAMCSSLRGRWVEPSAAEDSEYSSSVSTSLSYWSSLILVRSHAFHEAGLSPMKWLEIQVGGPSNVQQVWPFKSRLNLEMPWIKNVFIPVIHNEHFWWRMWKCNLSSFRIFSSSVAKMCYTTKLALTWTVYIWQSKLLCTFLGINFSPQMLGTIQCRLTWLKRNNFNFFYCQTGSFT